MIQATQNTQASILARALGSVSKPMTPELASYLMAVKLDPKDEQRANELAAKARSASLSAEEQAEIDEYRRVGRVIETLKLRAHQSDIESE